MRHENKRQLSVWVSNEAHAALVRLQDETGATQGGAVEAALIGQLGRTITGADVVAALTMAADLVRDKLTQWRQDARPAAPAAPAVQAPANPKPPASEPVSAPASDDPAQYGQPPRRTQHS